MSQPPQLPTLRQAGSTSHEGQQDELHITGFNLSPNTNVNSQHNYTSKIALDSSPAVEHLGEPPASQFPARQTLQQQLSASEVPNILQPGGFAGKSSPKAARAVSTHQTSRPGLILTPLSFRSPTDTQQYLGQLNPHSAMAQSHTYSQSSPTATLETSANYQAYNPGTPSAIPQPNIMSPSDSGKYGAAVSQRNFSTTPLGLADIRPRADSSMSDGTPGYPGPDASSAHPGPSNYLAPWAVYAFDWCKWAPQGNSSGKLALGSYLEDGHNFVSGRQ